MIALTLDAARAPDILRAGTEAMDGALGMSSISGICPGRLPAVDKDRDVDPEVETRVLELAIDDVAPSELDEGIEDNPFPDGERDIFFADAGSDFEFEFARVRVESAPERCERADNESARERVEEPEVDVVRLRLLIAGDLLTRGECEREGADGRGPTGGAEAGGMADAVGRERASDDEERFRGSPGLEEGESEVAEDCIHIAMERTVSQIRLSMYGEDTY